MSFINGSEKSSPFFKKRAVERNYNLHNSNFLLEKSQLLEDIVINTEISKPLLSICFGISCNLTAEQTLERKLRELCE